MKTLNSVLTFVLLFVASAQAQTPEDSTAQALLVRLDDARFPGAYEMSLMMETQRPGRDPLVYEYDIVGIGEDKSLMTVTDPPRERDKQILLNGDNLWFYVPDVSRPVKLTRKASFMGSVFSNEDVMNSTLADDYLAHVIERSERNGGVHYIVELTARTRSVAYAKMICGLDSASAIPDTITYFGLTGKALKQEVVNETAQLAGRERPSVMTMYDFLEEGAFTKVEIRKLAERENVPESMFDPTRLGN
ncbi:MAG: outer membrane lipoprotein-sorting protein [Calditrichaeota bacterium]|nr:outer membrane lipoprotein-sorting protein [Calditrichota bacterium]MCB9365842.1 outer membrane lipoprotein-sorting protein [Calditrichota bacterium]